MKLVISNPYPMTASGSIYRINNEDKITFVNDEFTKFALANDAPELTESNLLGRDFWKFITDDSTRYLYAQLIKRVRKGHAVQFEFRCDSPDERRDVEMRMSLSPIGEVEFHVRVLSAVPYEICEIRHRGADYSNGLTYVCSWCNRIKLKNGEWVEIYEAIGELGAIRGNFRSQLSHGICEDCYTTVSKLLTAAP